MSRADRGKLGCRKRWDADALAHGKPAGPRVVRLDELPAAERRIVLALLEGARRANDLSPERAG
jgi:hypothetical protein